MDKPGKASCVSPTLPTGRRLPTSFTTPPHQQGLNLCRREERLRGGHVATLAEHHVDQRARAIDGTRYCHMMAKGEPSQVVVTAIAQLSLAGFV